MDCGLGIDDWGFRNPHRGPSHKDHREYNKGMPRREERGNEGDGGLTIADWRLGNPQFAIRNSQSAIRTAVFGLLIVTAAVAPAVAQVSASEIEGLIDQLSSADYVTRESADKALRAVGTPAVEPLARSFKDTDDYETRVRIQRISEHIYFWDRVLGRNGFLGISHLNWRRSTYYNPQDHRIEPDKAAFVIRQVIDDTSAFRAGLRAGDVIVAIDGNTLPADANTTAFADQIRYKLPGTEMVFEFWRGNEFIEQKITIGHRPAAYYLRGSAPADLKKQYEDAVKEFPAWWSPRFGAWSLRVSAGYQPDHPQYLPLPQREGEPPGEPYEKKK